VLRRAKEIAKAHRCEAVWFGAAAPLALLAPTLRPGGLQRAVACTHGHEVGWAMLPMTRSALRRIGRTMDVVTFVSRYTRSRVAAAFGPLAALEQLPAGVDTALFRPDPGARSAIRARYRLSDRPVISCVSRLVPRKGQDVLVRALPLIRRRVPYAVLLLVGGGPYEARLRRLAERAGVGDHVRLTGPVPWSELPAHHAVGDVFAMPCRTHGGGLDVEGLGLVFLEAAASGLPVVAGRSGGAPETVRPGETGTVVDGRDVAEVADAVADLLADPDLAAKYGAAGRNWMLRGWRWDQRAAALAQLLG
jgi:phosphatidylinositol alpha-1,6-mannosyltransferase